MKSPHEVRKQLILDSLEKGLMDSVIFGNNLFFSINIVDRNGKMESILKEIVEDVKIDERKYYEILMKKEIKQEVGFNAPKYNSFYVEIREREYND